MPRPTPPLARVWYKTLKLPKSTFPPRTDPDAQVKYLQRSTDDLYAWQQRNRKTDSETFVLHDGPPYANGKLHVGHALNKVLKDIIVRVQLAKGKKVDFVPGWDCHGLPIELRALELHRKSKNPDLRQYWNGGNVGAGAAAVRKAARSLADDTVLEQMKQFKEFGVMADWENRWKTMDKEFETKQLEVFMRMVESGFITRRHRPVYWSPSSGTALAEAELEYKDDFRSTAAVVKYRLVDMPNELKELNLNEDIHAAIWTTTPWTLPANAAIAVNPDLLYCVVSSRKHGFLIVASDRKEYIRYLIGESKDEFVVVAAISGAALISQATYQPLFKDGASPQRIIGADYVTAESGSGLVHTAPGHGMEDYETCKKYGIEGHAPVDNFGNFTAEAFPANPELLTGKPVLGEGNKTVLEYLEQTGNLVASHHYEHKYPVDWRAKKPVIIRATAQWFADLGVIRESALEAIKKVNFVPASARARLEAFVNNRKEWCISRQRAWGVPIPALYNTKTGEAVLTKESVGHIIKTIDERGIDAWWTDAEDEAAWIPPSLLEEHKNGTLYKRGTDTMDVWFDSGSSWTQIQKTQDKSTAADVYIEGTDQHRGWFQSSLLTHVADQLARGQKSDFTAPFKTLITHGFTLDQNAKKMSKSLGNVVTPQEIIEGRLAQTKYWPKKKIKGTPHGGNRHEGLGLDALRLWAAGGDYTKDVVISPHILKATNVSLHKLRITFRLLLGALTGFNPRDESHVVPYDKLHNVDKIALLQLHVLNNTCRAAFENYEFYKAVNALTKYTNMDFSAFYMETLKDRLYTEAEHSHSRRAAQSTLWHVYTQLQGLLAPILPMLVEESWEHASDMLKEAVEHPLHRVLAAPPAHWDNKELAAGFPMLMAVNSQVKLMQEVARNAKLIGSSLQSFVHIHVPCSPQEAPIFETMKDELADLYVVSRVDVSYDGQLAPKGKTPKPSPAVDTAAWFHAADFEILDGRTGRVWVYEPQMDRCPRCWKYNVEPRSKEELQRISWNLKVEGKEPPQRICRRCYEVVQELDADRKKKRSAAE